jgi:hypothetical protein
MFWTLLVSAAIASPPVGIVALDHVQPVELTESFIYEWNAERAETRTATVLVVEVSPGAAKLHQTGAPVLYVGNSPAARVHPGETDHHIVVLIPGHPNLSDTPIFWGPDTLPEKVTLQMGTDALRTVQGQPFPPTVTKAVTQPLLQVDNQGELYRHMAKLIDVYAPSDHHFSTSIRVTLQP